MAPRRKESAVDLCDKAVVLGNSIAIRMLEYLSTVKNRVQGFPDLATEFLEVSRILWAIESGLKTSTAGDGGKRHELPGDMRAELEKRFRQTHDDFIVLNQLVTRFIDNDKKQGFARFSKGFKMMFADSDVNKMRHSLEKTREALRMSALVFRWSLGEDDVLDATISMGYTGLAAALDQMKGISGRRLTTNPPASLRPPSKEPPSTPQPARPTQQHQQQHDQHQNQNHPAGTQAQRVLSQGGHSERGPFDEVGTPALPALPALDRLQHESNRSTHSLEFMGSRLTGATAVDAEDLHELGLRDHRDLPERAPSTVKSARSSKAPHNFTVTECTVSEMSSPRSLGRSTGHGDNGSTHTAETDTLLEDLLLGSGGGGDIGSVIGSGTGNTAELGGAGSDIGSLQLNSPTGAGFGTGAVTRLKADPSTVQRWTPRSGVGAGNAQYKAALVQAVQRRSHGAMEQLLDRGVLPDSVGEPSLLREAVLNRDAEALRLLLLFGADPNAVDKAGHTPLLAAAEAAFLDAAKLLIRYGADANQSAGPNADTPLAVAALEGRLDLVQLLLMYGGDPNRLMANGNTVLIRAVDRRTPKRLVELMLAYGSDPNAKNAEGTSPLFQCVSVQRLDLAHLLLDRGADPNLPGPKHLLWPSAYQPPFLRLLLARGADHARAPGIMELATSVNNIESVRVLLAAGVDPNAKKDGVYTPLCSAIRDDRADIVTLLLASGADPNVPASEYPCFKCVTHQRAHFLPQLLAAGGDPEEPRGIVEKAVRHNNQDALVLLLDHGVGVNVKSPEGFTPLTTAIREDRADMVDLLLARGADPAIRGQDWPLHLAVKRPHILKKLLPAVTNPRAFKGVVEMAVCADQLESIRLLLSAGFSVEDKNGGVFSPLTSAIREGNKPVVRYLIDEAGANVNAPGEHLPIIKAIRRMRGADTEILELLLDRGADINLMYRGWNAVLQAVENGDANVLRLLVEKGNGVNLELTDDNGQTVMDIVNGLGWEEAVQIINNTGGAAGASGSGSGSNGNGGSLSGRMSIFSELSWAQILGENGTDSNSQSRTSMDTITEMGH